MDFYLLAFFIITTTIVFLFYVGITDYKNKETAKTKLLDDGFKYIFSGGGNQFIAFNLPRGMFRIGNLTGYSYIERPIRYISDCQWEWKEQNAIKFNNKFIFYISDVEHSMQKVFYQNSERLAEIEWAKIQAILSERNSVQNIEASDMKQFENFDFFISHASEDKDDFVRHLANELTELGLKIWYDEFSLEIGDSLRRSIDYGLGNSRFGIVVLSRAFFAKQWPQYELDALVNKAMSGEKVILPIWHGVQHQDVS